MLRCGASNMKPVEEKAINSTIYFSYLLLSVTHESHDNCLQEKH